MIASQHPQMSASRPSGSQANALAPAKDSSQLPLTQGQAEVMLARLTIVKQRLLRVLIMGSFFADCALFFHC